MKCIRRRGRGQLVGAFVLITIGILFLLIENHIIERFNVWSLWPLILVFVGAAKLTQSTSGEKGLGVALISLGIVFELSELGYLPFRPYNLWPLILVAAGGALLWKTLARTNEETGNADPESFTMFGGVERRITAPAFTGTEMTAIFGGYQVDLRKAQIAAEKAVITATAIFGGIELIIPESWVVDIHGSPIFGSYSDETIHHDVASPGPRLIIEGFAMFGGITIKN
jgi:predicted membrane protein